MKLHDLLTPHEHAAAAATTDATRDDREAAVARTITETSSRLARLTELRDSLSSARHARLAHESNAADAEATLRTFFDEHQEELRGEGITSYRDLARHERFAASDEAGAYRDARGALASNIVNTRGTVRSVRSELGGPAVDLPTTDVDNAVAMLEARMAELKAQVEQLERTTDTGSAAWREQGRARFLENRQRLPDTDEPIDLASIAVVSREDLSFGDTYGDDFAQDVIADHLEEQVAHNQERRRTKSGLDQQRHDLESIQRFERNRPLMQDAIDRLRALVKESTPKLELLLAAHPALLAQFKVRFGDKGGPDSAATYLEAALAMDAWGHHSALSETGDDLRNLDFKLQHTGRWDHDLAGEGRLAPGFVDPDALKKILDGSVEQITTMMREVTARPDNFDFTTAGDTEGSRAAMPKFHELHADALDSDGLIRKFIASDGTPNLIKTKGLAGGRAHIEHDLRVLQEQFAHERALVPLKVREAWSAKRLEAFEADHTNLERLIDQSRALRGDKNVAEKVLLRLMTADTELAGHRALPIVVGELKKGRTSMLELPDLTAAEHELKRTRAAESRLQQELDRLRGIKRGAFQFKKKTADVQQVAAHERMLAEAEAARTQSLRRAEELRTIATKAEEAFGVAVSHRTIGARIPRASYTIESLTNLVRNAAEIVIGTPSDPNDDRIITHYTRLREAYETAEKKFDAALAASRTLA